MSQTVSVLETQRLFEEMQAALAETEKLYDISAQFNAATTLEEILDAATLPGIAAGASNAGLFIFDPDVSDQPETIELAAMWQDDDNSILRLGTRLRLPDFTSAAHRVWPDDPTRPLFISDPDADELIDPLIRAFFLEIEPQAVIVMPLTIGERWLGLIVIHWQFPHTFTDSEERLYKLATEQAAVVLDNRLLFEQVHQRAHEIEHLYNQMHKRAVELETVVQVSTAASTILEAEQLLQTVVDLTKTSFDLYHVQIYLLDEAHKTLSLIAGAGDVGQQLVARRQAIPLDWEGSLVARAARTGRAIIVNDVRDSFEYLPSRLLPDTRGEMAVPMIVANRVLGVLDVQSAAINRFTDEDVRIQTILAAQVAVALENARRFEKERQTAIKLREMDRLKSEFLTNMSHELRTPLNSIIGFSEVLLGGLDGELSQNALADVSAIHTSGQHLLALINDILDLAKIEAGKMELKRNPLTVNEVMATVRATVQSLLKEKSIQLIIPDFSHLPPFNADSVRIKQIILNLVSNAIKFTDEGYVAIDVKQEKSQLIFSVEDTGVGIPPHTQHAVFERFHQVDGSSTRKAGGTGLGLTITRHLVGLHGGQIWLESQPGVGSTFYFSIPLDDE